MDEEWIDILKKAGYSAEVIAVVRRAKSLAEEFSSTPQSPRASDQLVADINVISKRVKNDN